MEWWRKEESIWRVKENQDNALAALVASPGTLKAQMLQNNCRRSCRIVTFSKYGNLYEEAMYTI